MATAAVHDAHAAHPTGWKRYVYATNHKDIGTMYLIFAIIAGVIGGSLSIAMRIELQRAGHPDFPRARADGLRRLGTARRSTTASTCTTCSRPRTA